MYLPGTASQETTSDPLLRAVETAESVVRVGRVSEAFGTMIRATGVGARIGETCEMSDPITGQRLFAEVVGISGHQTLLTPMGGLDGISASMQVKAIGGRAMVAVGDELLGRVIDAQCGPIDGGPALRCDECVPLYRDAPNPLRRAAVDRPLATGVRAIDSTLTIGLGQRVGIFAVAGGGKSTLLGMLARGAESDVNVIVLVGERGREVREFMEDSLGADGLKRSVVVVATSDRPALERSRAAHVGTAIAEYFRDQGKRVVLMMDSVTRYARALRDVGLALGEPPARRGFPPSVFSMLPKLFERVGNNERGYITAFYTVLLEDEEAGDDPIGEEVRSLLDGHIILSRKLAAAAHYPAIDILQSASRVMSRVVSKAHTAAAAEVRRRLAKYNEIELLLQVGEYKAGSDAAADLAIQSIGSIRKLLQQDAHQLNAFDETVALMQEVIR